MNFFVIWFVCMYVCINIINKFSEYNNCSFGMVFTLFDGLNQFEWYIHSYFNNLLQYSWNLEHTNKFEFDLQSALHATAYFVYEEGKNTNDKTSINGFYLVNSVAVLFIFPSLVLSFQIISNMLFWNTFSVFFSLLWIQLYILHVFSCLLCSLLYPNVYKLRCILESKWTFILNICFCGIFFLDFHRQ